MNPIVGNVLEQLRQPDDVGMKPPDKFDFGVDTIDQVAEHHDKAAFMAISGDGERTRVHRPQDLRGPSNRLAKALHGTDVSCGDSVVATPLRIPA